MLGTRGLARAAASLALAAGTVGAAPAAAAVALHQLVGGCGGRPAERTLPATPATYLSVIAGAGPGDRVLLAPGDYESGLPLSNRHSEPNRCLVIEGPADGPPARLLGSDSFNTVSIRRSSYLVVRNLELDGLGLAGDGVKAEPTSNPGDTDWAHHITIEGLRLVGYGADQQRVGISTKVPTWSWVIRRNSIVGAGTGLYLGNSDGSAEHVAGLIERNLVVDPIGYGLQIKHQNGRATGLGMPAEARTVIRHNVIAKAAGYSIGDDARPNLLVGHWPLSGPGASDVYEIYGNLLYQNPSGEALFQGEGNLALYANLLVNRDGSAIWIQPHEDVPRDVAIFWNTVVARDDGIRVTGGAAGTTQLVRGNAVFAGTPLSGGSQSGNATGAFADADQHLVAPEAPLGAGLDLVPLQGELSGAVPVDTAGLEGFRDFDRDFDGLARPDLLRRGAYGRAAGAPSWPLALAPEPAAAVAASFYTLTPCRLVDTRQPAGITGGPALAGSAVRPLPVAGRCGVPYGAVAIAANVTVVGPSAPGHLDLYPWGEPVPPTSTVNFRAGQTRANNAVVPLSDSGEVAARAVLAGAVHLVVDVTGYFE